MLELKKQFSFMKHRKIYYVVALVILLISLVTGFARGFNFGIDFTGGTNIQINMGKVVDAKEIKDILMEKGIEADVIHGGENNDQIIIRTTESLNMEAKNEVLEGVLSKYQLDDKAVVNFEQFGPSVGDMLKQNAIKALLITGVCMLIYIAFRFEWKFGVAAVLVLSYDVLFVLGFYGLFHFPINNPFIAGLLTIVGYAINDTIVVFDRIRENLKLGLKLSKEELVNKSINQTLVRSIMTSFLTALAIIPLYIMGAETIKQFTLPLIVGIIGGTCGSIFIASPLWLDINLYFDKKNGKKSYPGKQSSKPKKEKKVSNEDKIVV